MTQSYDQLIGRVAEIEAELRRQKEECAVAKQEAVAAKLALSKANRRIKILQTLSLSMVASLEVEELYALVCQSIVNQLSWDFALMVALHGNRLVRLGAYEVNDGQRHSLDDYLASNATFRDAYLQRTSFATFALPEAQATVLRSLFQANELAGAPLLFGDQLLGYLIVGDTPGQPDEGRKERGESELDFLSALAALVAHAIQNSTSFSDLEKQNIKLRELDELKNTFISITSHQLRTPLSIIKWILALLQTESNETAKRQELVGQAYETNERMIRVVNNLLNVSRIQEGQLPYTPQTISLTPMLHDLCRGSGKLAEQHQVNLKEEVVEKLPLVEVDPILFKEAIQNLLDNAIVYNRKGGKVILSAEVGEEEVRIRIQDTGIGMGKEDQEKIFSEFYRADEAIRLQPNGNGLGLYLTKAIIRQHGGEVTCQSEPGQGTVFTVTIPV